MAKDSKKQAGYMELSRARENAECKKVEGDVSTLLGCCNLFEPKSDKVASFRCGNCEYVQEKAKDPFFGS